MRKLRPTIAVLLGVLLPIGISAETEFNAVGPNDAAGGSVDASVGNATGIEQSPEELAATLVPQAVDTVKKLGPQAEARESKDKEVVWGEINMAISHLNDRIGSEMFRHLNRLSSTELEVRLDTSYWERVLYQTRVSLKNDISDIWHLFVNQYNGDSESAVFFIDDRSEKTIDIFIRSKMVSSTKQ